MYYERQKKIAIISAIIVVVFIVGICSVSAINAGKRKAVNDNSSQEEWYEVTVYKSTEGLLTCTDLDMQKEEDENKLILTAKAGDVISLDILPDDGRLYSSSEVRDEKAGYILVSEEKPDNTAPNEKRISFTMPKSNVTVNIYYMEDFTATDNLNEPEDGEESKSPYNITIKGMTKKIKKSYRGYFDEEDFIRAVGNWFGMGNAASDYSKVTKATFTGEKYEEDTEDTISHYLYFNDEQEWKILATFEFATKTYQFVDIRQKEKEEAEIAAKKAQQEKEKNAAVTPKPTTSAGSSQPDDRSSGGDSSPGVSYTEPVQESQEDIQEIELSIVNVSSRFLEFVGNEEAFYTAVHDYLSGLGFTGAVTGEFDDFVLDQEKGLAEFTILLGESGAVYGVYDQSNGEFSF